LGLYEDFDLEAGLDLRTGADLPPASVRSLAAVFTPPEYLPTGFLLKGFLSKAFFAGLPEGLPLGAFPAAIL